MEIERISKRLNSEKSKNSVDKDIFINLDFKTKENPIPLNDINKIIKVSELFNKERQACGAYRIINTINPIISNSLFNLSNSNKLNKDTLSGFNSFEFLDYSYPKDNDINDDGDLTFKDSIKKHLKEKNGWFGYYDSDVTKESLCIFNDMEPKRERFSFTPDLKSFNNNSIVKNWDITITYPKSMDKTHKLVNGGLLVIDFLEVIISTKKMTAIGVPSYHNLNVGDTVKLSGTLNFDGEHEVVGLGDNLGNNKGFYFIIDVDNSGGLTENIRMKKMVNGYESEYYFRKFRKIKTKNGQLLKKDDYEIFKLAFSENVFNDIVYQYTNNSDIYVDGLVDNLGRPISEIFLTIIKTDSDNLFTNVSSGIESPYIDNLNSGDVNIYLRDIPLINKIHNGVGTPFISHKPLENNVTIENNNKLIGNNEFYGDLVEYNKYTLNETVLSDVLHRFNTINRESNSQLTYVDGKPLNIKDTIKYNTINLGPRQEGYLYKPHNRFKIREFSNYIEEGDNKSYDIPEYSETMKDGTYSWRDLLDIGFNDANEKTINYPFINGSHYLYNTLNFELKRQDQFGFWNLLHTNFPMDVFGERIKDEFTINKKEDNDC